MNRHFNATRKQVRLLRRNAGLTQELLAERARLSVETIQRLERSGRASSSTVTAIAQALGVDVREVIGKQQPLVISCMSEKGGVGRTTLTFNLSVLLGMRGESVCAVQLSDYGQLYKQCRISRRKPLPKISACLMPEPQLLEDWVGAARSYSYILVDGTRYRPDFNAVLIANSDLILIPITNIDMDEGPLDTLMGQVAATRNIGEAPILLVFNRIWATSHREVAKDLLRIERRYGRQFASAVMVNRKTFAVSENRSFLGPLNSPLLAPNARDARKACRELADLWKAMEAVIHAP